MSHRGDLTERMVLIPLLLAERPRSQKELTSRFSVNRKTIKRDIDVLSLHYPIEEEIQGREVQYGFSDGYKFKPPPLTPSELAPLLLAQESIAATGLTAFGSPFAEFINSMLAKVRSSLPQSLRERLDALASVFGTAAAPAKDFAPHAETIERLTNAAVARHRLSVRYYSLNEDRVTDRDVDPYSVYFDPDGATLKLIAYDHRRKEISPLAIDHIRSLRETGDSFERPAGFDLREFLAENCFNGIHGEPILVRLRAHGVTARIFAERTFHRSQRQIERKPHTADDDETTTIEMRVARGRGLVRFILSWSPDIEVLAPDEVIKQVADAHRRSLAWREHE